MQAIVNEASVLNGPAAQPPEGLETFLGGVGMPFSEALAQCSPAEDILAGLCAAAGIPLSYEAMEQVWPFVRERVKAPCGCKIVYPSFLMTLCHLYDSEDWPLSNLVKWSARMEQRLSYKELRL